MSKTNEFVDLRLRKLVSGLGGSLRFRGLGDNLRSIEIKDWRLYCSSLG
jgi:hypothetical protein